MTHGPKREAKLTSVVDASERLVYYGVSALLIVAIGMIFISTVLSMLQVLEAGVLQTTLTILDQTLLILIFIELLNTMGIVAREQGIVAEPFLLIGLVAVVRRILSTSAQAEQAIGTERFSDLTTQLEVMAALVVALTIALYVARRTYRSERSAESS